MLDENGIPDEVMAKRHRHPTWEDFEDNADELYDAAVEKELLEEYCDAPTV